MPKLIFRGAYIRFIDLRFDEKSKTVYQKINFTASWTDKVREAMEWGEPPAGFSSAKLDGEFSAKNMTLIPNGIKNQDVELEARDISGFELHRVKGEDGESTENELRFQVISCDENAASKLREYLSVIGKGQAQLKVAYEAQSDLEMEAEAAEDQPGLISEEQAADTAEDADGALASAALMGGTHQRKTREKKRGDAVN